jgi:hypothetical protein
MENIMKIRAFAVSFVAVLFHKETGEPKLFAHCSVAGSDTEALNWIRRQQESFTNPDGSLRTFYAMDHKDDGSAIFRNTTNDRVIDTEDYDEVKAQYEFVVQRTVVTEITVTIEDADDEEEAEEKLDKMIDRDELEWRHEGIEKSCEDEIIDRQEVWPN